MKVEGEYLFDVAPQQVWEGLLDPEVLAATMPGCEQLELVGENQYEGMLNIKVGPVQGKFQGKIQLEDIRESEGYTMKVDGRGTPGFVKATATVGLSGEGNQTRLAYNGDAQVGGRIASVGQRLLDSSAKAIIKQSLDGLNETLKARSAADSGDEPAETAVLTPPAPSQAEFAARVAKEVVKDLIPKPVLIGGAILLILLLLYLFAF
ncbi:MAG: carbon monoxide dehydrogenase subunit G [Thermoanaerobaculia bacterium]